MYQNEMQIANFQYYLNVTFLLLFAYFASLVLHAFRISYRIEKPLGIQEAVQYYVFLCFTNEEKATRAI